MNRSLTCAVLVAFALGCTTPAPRMKAQSAPAAVRESPPAPSCTDLEQFRSYAVKTDEALRAHSAALAAWKPGTTVTAENRAALTALARAWVRECAVAETVELTKQLVAFPTVSAEEPTTGPAFVGMARFLEDWSKRHGFEFVNFKQNAVWEVRTGPGDAVLSFLTHGDVVPVREGDAKGPLPEIPPGWTHPPFKAELAGDRLYGRGSEDDKGPIAASLVVMRALKQFGLEPERPVIAVIGNGEEHDWTGMREYAEQVKKPTHVVSLDSNFPVVAAESGFVAWELEVAKGRNTGPRCVSALDVHAGQFRTQVPGEGVLVVRPPSNVPLAALLARAEQLALSEVHPGVRAITVASAGEKKTREVVTETGERLPYEVIFELGEDTLTIKLVGEAVHSSVAEQGHNAMWALSELGSGLGLCEGGIRTMLELVKDQFAGDLWGERLGLAYSHPFMGRLLVVPTVLRTEEGRVRLSVNQRRPTGLSGEEFNGRLDQAMARLQAQYGPTLREVRAERYVADPAIADLEGTLVPRLLELYARHTGEKDPKPVSIRGGTYARLFPGAVSFGPNLPGRPYRGHAPDEYIELGSLELLTRAIFDLAVDPP